MVENTEERKDCPMRHENGNCMVIGGFCIDAVSDEICHGLHNAYDKGLHDGAERMKKHLENLKTSLNQFAVSNSAAGKVPGGCFFGGDTDGHRDISGRDDRRWIYRRVSYRAGFVKPRRRRRDT